MSTPYGCFNPAGQCATAHGLDAYNAHFGCLAFSNAVTGCEPAECPPVLCDDAPPASIWPTSQQAFLSAMTASPGSPGRCGYSAPVTASAGAAPADASADTSQCAMHLLRHIVRVLNTTTASGCTGPCLGADQGGTTGCCSVVNSTATTPASPVVSYAFPTGAPAPQLTFAGATTSAVLAKYQNYMNALLYCRAASCSCGAGASDSAGVPRPCSGRGSCEPATVGSGAATWACECNAGASGVVCETTVNGGACPVAWSARTSSTLPCSGGDRGVCINGACVCFPPWSGAACELLACPAVNGEECSGNGTCTEFRTCACAAGYANGPAGACECQSNGGPCATVTPDAYTPVPGGGAGVNGNQDVIFGTPGGTSSTASLRATLIAAGVVLGLLIATILWFGLRERTGGLRPPRARSVPAPPSLGYA